MKQDDVLTREIIGCSYQVHSQLGPGFSEKIYHKALTVALSQKNIEYEIEKEFKIKFDNTTIGSFRADLVVRKKVIVEVKAVDGLLPKLFETQVVSYLKASGCLVGLLINFGGIKCQVRRMSLSL